MNQLAAPTHPVATIVDASPPTWLDQSLFGALAPAAGGTPFGATVPTQPLVRPHWVARSQALAQTLGLGAWLSDDASLPVLAGQRAPGQPESFASVYSGHQFGVWAGQLGDGRAHLLGTIASPQGPMEVQLKGCGSTPYSRMGDGRAVLRSSIREFLASEAMHALGIPTTRALAVVGSSMPVRRETIETAAVVARVAPSFLRFGHFEHFTHTARDVDALRALTDAAIEHYFPSIDTHGPERYLALLQSVVERTAHVIADWQAVGFCHGVMNTDNMSLLGLTIDYGPYGFLDAYVPGHICNHSDHDGRYAYARQPGVGLWNLSALAHALMPLIDDMATVKAALQTYPAMFEAAMLARMRRKLGLVGGIETDPSSDADHDARAVLERRDTLLVQRWLQLLADGGVDFTLAHRLLAEGGQPLRDYFADRASFDGWLIDYRAGRGSDPGRAAAMNRVNPKYVLRNHLAHAAIERAQGGDFTETQRLLGVLEKPFDDQPEFDAYAQPPPEGSQPIEVSCSS